MIHRISRLIGARRINTRLLVKIAAALIIVIALAGITGFFIVPPLLKPMLIEKASQALHRDVSFKEFSINPYTLSVTLSGLKIRDKDRPSYFFSLEEIHLDLEGPASLLKRGLVLKEVRITRPYLHIVRHADGNYNFADLLPGRSDEPKEKSPFHFSVNNIRILDGSIDFEDGPMKARHSVRNLNLDIPFVSNIGHAVDQYVEPKFSARINGQPYSLAGKTKPFSASRETSIDLDIRAVDLPFYLKYLPVKFNCRLASALLDARVSIRFLMPEGKAPSVNLAGKLALTKVVLDDANGAKVLRLPALETEIASADPFAGAYHLSKVSLQSPELVIAKDRAGEINLLTLVAPAGPSKPDASKKPETVKKEATAPGKGPGSKVTPKVTVDEFTIASADISFADGSLSEPAQTRLAPLNLKATRLSTEKGAMAEVDLTLGVNGKGRLSAKGKLGLEPMTALLDIEARDLGVQPFQPYFTDLVRINVARGDLSAAGRLSVEPGAGKAGSGPAIRYGGTIALSRLATRDKATAERFLGWRQLYFDQVDAGFNPLFVNIKGISLSDFYARIAVAPDGTLNLQTIFGGKEGPEKAPAGPKTDAGPVETAKAPGEGLPRNVKIGKVTLQGGTIDFTDRHITPNYSAKMLKVGGSVTGLSSEEISRAAVDLRGNLGFGSPIEITGRINPLGKDLFADVKLGFRDIELSPITPYSSKYIGHPILKGKLTFEVAYLIEKRKLEARNKIFIDQLTFGERVESPDAIKAPVPLAVSLLSDRNGQIQLDIPLSGSLDDPQFEVWPLVWKVIGNLIAKAATAPFSLLASLIGGGEEMSYIEFDYGSDTVTPAGEQKIKSLARALAERPSLRLEIAGSVDTERDQEGLRRAELDRKMKLQKMKDLARRGTAPAPLGQIRIDPPEYGKYLTAAYGAETFPKPRNVVGLVKGLPPEEMEKLMLAHANVTAGDLRLLALRRAEHVKELLLKGGDIQAGRIFLLESASTKKKDNAKESRVDFTLK